MSTPADKKSDYNANNKTLHYDAVAHVYKPPKNELKN
jgi:hypothetical protein